jgi:glycosyltransferase involved in cell wall biosynthesis
VKFINFQILTTTDIVLFASMVVVFIIQLYFLLKYYLKLALNKDVPGNLGSEATTVILPVRNEEERIREILDRFNDQQEKNYQVLVISVNSEDNTMEILNVLAATNPHLKFTSLNQDTRFTEKQVINIGLKGASSPRVILLTPLSGKIDPEWLSKLNNLFDAETDVVVAYSNVERKKGYRNLICRLERFNQFMISGSRTLAGKPIVFGETNILFKKSLYFDTQGFRQKLNLNFANLELIFNENLKRRRVKVSTDPATVIRETVEDDRGDHIRLLKKSVQIRQSLSFFKKAGLFVDDLTRILVPASAVALVIIHPEYWISMLILPLIFLVLLLFIVKMIMNRVKERKIFLSSLAYIFIKPIINWWFFWSMYLMHRRNRWN